MTLPLSGITVLEFSQYLAGSYAEATSINGDFTYASEQAASCFQ
jgi:hypothetical protein